MDLFAQAGAGIGAIAALGTAASGLVDSTKVFGGGVSRFGFAHIRAALEPFDAALVDACAAWPRATKAGAVTARRKQAATADWQSAVMANWINGRPKTDQKAAAKALIHVGLTPANATALARAGHVDAAIFTAAVTAVAAGQQPTAEQSNILGQFDAAIDAAMDGAYERADQQYRNMSKIWAGAVAIILAFLGGAVIAAQPGVGPNGASLPGIGFSAYLSRPDVWRAILIGVVAVPLAPVAKDLTSSIQALATALKVTRP